MLVQHAMEVSNLFDVQIILVEKSGPVFSQSLGSKVSKDTFWAHSTSQRVLLTPDV